MPDLASLGIQVDSSQAKTATGVLGELSGASGNVSKSLQTQYDRTQMASKAFESYNAIVKSSTATTSDLAKQQLELSKSLSAANDNMKSNADSFYEGKRSLIDFGSEILKLALHLKLLATLLYAINPAFRAFVNDLLLIAIPAPMMAKLIGAFEKMKGVITAVQAVWVGFMSFMRTVAGPLLLIAAAYEFIKTAIDQSNAELDKFRKLSSEAASAGVGIDFLQRYQKAAEAVGLKIDDMTASLIKFKQQSKLTLEGSSETGAPSSVLLDRIEKLQEANPLFKNNTGVADFKGAKDAEERYRAVVKIIGEAMDAGQRLIALDIAKNAGFSDETIAKLEMFPHILDDMLEKADAFKETDLIDEEVVTRTLQLEDRLTAALKILKDFAGPVADLKEWGLLFKGIWVDIVETAAKLVKLINDMMNVVPQTPEWVKTVGSWLAKLGATGLERSGLNAIGFTSAVQGTFNGLTGATSSSVPTVFGPTATPGELARADRFTLRQQQNLPDSSRRPTTDTTAAETNQFTRLAESIERSTAARKADAATVGLGIQAHEQMHVQLQLEQAAMQVIVKEGGSLDQYRDKINKLAVEAGKTAQLLEEAKLKSEITFGQRTALFTQEDVQIASQLKTLYGDDVPKAMESAYASALRFNQVTKDTANAISSNLSSALVDWATGTKTFSQAIQDMSRSVVKALTEIIIKLTIVGPMMRALQSSFSGFGLSGLLGMPAGSFGENVSAGQFTVLDAAAGTPASFGKSSALGNIFSGPGIGAFSNNLVTRPTIFPFAKGVGLMGEAGPEAVMPLKRGSDGKLGVSGAGMKVIINNNNSNEIAIKQSTQQDVDGEALVLDIVKKAQGRGEFDATNSSLYALRRRKVR